jgi:cytochrome oxidase complex assembly protein 1
MTRHDAIGGTGIPPPRNWWQRNWKWVVPVGCASMIVLLAGFVFSLVFFVFSVIRSTDVFRDAVERAQASPEVQAELGAPVEQGWWVSGSVETSGPSGSADISIPLEGSEKDGTLYAVAHKSAGRWSYDTLEVEVEGKEERIDLLAEEAPP